jgi:hypothetical protein
VPISRHLLAAAGISISDDLWFGVKSVSSAIGRAEVWQRLLWQAGSALQYKSSFGVSRTVSDWSSLRW